MKTVITILGTLAVVALCFQLLRPSPEVEVARREAFLAQIAKNPPLPAQKLAAPRARIKKAVAAEIKPAEPASVFPEYGWHKFDDKTISLQVLHPFTPVTLPLPTTMARSPEDKSLRVEVDATDSVSFGVFPLKEDNQVDASSPATCSASRVLNTQQDCELPSTNSAIVFVDGRGGSSFAGTVAGALLRNGEMLNRSSKPNRVKYTLYRWQCISNCS